jgi:hypothetical protein
VWQIITTIKQFLHYFQFNISIKLKKKLKDSGMFNFIYFDNYLVYVQRPENVSSLLPALFEHNHQAIELNLTVLLFL